MKQVLVVGNGMAGLTAAIRCAQLGMKVILAAPSEAERTQSVMAMGGINAVTNTKGESDTVEYHFEDTMRSGAYINNSKAVYKMVSNAPDIIQWLLELGTNFTLDENGNVDLRYFGGQKKRRTAYAGTSTGKQIMTALVNKCRELEAREKITQLHGMYFLKPIFEKRECLGALFYKKDNSVTAIYADAIIVAVGGPNGVFGKTTGSIQNSGGVAGILLKHGVEFENLEMIQFHPTTIDVTSKHIVITEAARGAGGKLYTYKNNKKWYFMKEWYPDMKELMPRDIVSQSIYKVCNQMNLGIDGNQYIYLDISHLDKDFIQNKLNEVINICKHYLGIDPCKEPIPVYPEMHYFMGGIKTDEYHRTNIKRLYAIGECSSQYHGANRLGGNSLLGAINGGFAAAEDCLKLQSINSQIRYLRAPNSTFYNELIKIIKYSKNQSNAYNSILEMDKMLGEIMKKALGIVRNKSGLLEAENKILDIENSLKNTKFKDNYYQYLTLLNKLFLAKAFIKSAFERKESRGSHQRSDYPETNNQLYKSATRIIYKNNSFEFTFTPNKSETNSCLEPVKI